MYFKQESTPVYELGEFGNPGSNITLFHGDTGEFGQISAGEAAAVGIGTFALWALGLVVIGGVIIWVVRSIKKA